jgi:hypothetical protein
MTRRRYTQTELLFETSATAQHVDGTGDDGVSGQADRGAGSLSTAAPGFACSRLFPSVRQHSYCGEKQDREMNVIAPVPAREVHGRRCAAF